jgi:cyanobactin maturation PatA/PatG family protease
MLATGEVALNLLLPGLSDLWALSEGDPGICVAVLDGAIDTSHGCFSGCKLQCIENTVACAPTKGGATLHGTHVASIIFGQHSTEIKGIAPSCRGILIPIFSESAQNTVRPASQLDLARGITRALSEGANVINISAGQLEKSGEPEPRLAQAVQYCRESGILIVAAAGNDGCECLHVPAALPSVLAVGAADHAGKPLDSSNWSDQYRRLGILAPGEQIPGALPGGGVGCKTGTSFATPIVTGVVALLLSLQIRQRGVADAMEVREAILRSAIACSPAESSECERHLAGTINISGALELLGLGSTRQAGSSTTRQAVWPAEALLEKAELRKVETQAQLNHFNSLMQGGRTKLSDETSAVLVSSEPTLGVENVAPGVSTFTPSALASGGIQSTAGGVLPSDCSCGGKGKSPGHSEAKSDCGCGGKGKPPLVYALGELGIDYGTEARRDSFVQAGLTNPHDPSQLITFLNTNPTHSGALIWTLNQDTTPIYGIQPASAFAASGYEILRQSLNAQLKEGAERISVPGIMVGQVTLLNGQIIPVVVPDIRGIYSWSSPKLIQAVAGSKPTAKDELAKFESRTQDVLNFLERVYYEIRNLGVTPQERAINFSATNAFQIEFVFRSAVEGGQKLDSISAERSPICRPGSDCWDVKLTFFNPSKRFEQAKHVYRFTVDVSDVIPVTVGKVRHWDVY